MENNNTLANWEDEKIEMKRKLFKHVETFLIFDAQANSLMLDILKLVKQNFERDPNAFHSDSNLKEILRELKAKGDKGSDADSDIKGGDIVGGGALQDIIDFIKTISVDLIAKEKDFFMQIIKLIFCGC
jgi:hypothetical protein